LGLRGPPRWRIRERSTDRLTADAQEGVMAKWKLQYIPKWIRKRKKKAAAKRRWKRLMRRERERQR